MTFNHEYHLAQTAEVNRVASPKTSVSRKAFNLSRILLICIIFGAVSLVLVLVFIRPLISQSSDNENNYESISASFLSNDSYSISFMVEEYEEDNYEKFQPKKSFETSLSPSEEDAIRKLRLEVEDKLTSNYMKTASYLVRWLRARDWDVEDAKEMLLDHLEWRVEYDMDSVLEANLTFLETEYPVYEDGTDYQGGPVVSVNLEDWDLRRVTVGGYERDFFRYFFRMFERGIKIAEDLHRKGRNTTQGMFIANLNNYSMTKQGCFSCIALTIRILFGMDDNYPGWLHHIILINTSDIAGVVIDMFLPYINGENRAAFQVYGFNKVEWQQKILSLIAADQIRSEFGGTKNNWND